MSSPDPRPGDPSGVFMQMAEIVYARASYRDVYDSICATAVEVIPGCDHVCISSLRAGRELTCEGANDEVASLVDRFERETGQGPCLDAILDESYQHDPDITVHSTWPELSKQVLEHTPVRSMIGYRLLVGGRKAGALNIFGDVPGALTERSAEIGAIVAAFASVALAGLSHHERAETLKRGLETNREIGKAIGLLMATHHIDDAAAFDVLRRASSEMNVKLAEIARRVVDDQKAD
ncbi:MAG TPA: GAF and ANTAR domain-containing protein [Nocardioidaceae bacterium]|nr:GAF and ANTAR domain-containing protein [Nocardioidaceae bacterium]